MSTRYHHGQYNRVLRARLRIALNTLREALIEHCDVQPHTVCSDACIVETAVQFIGMLPGPPDVRNEPGDPLPTVLYFDNS